MENNKTASIRAFALAPTLAPALFFTFLAVLSGCSGDFSGARFSRDIPPGSTNGDANEDGVRIFFQHSNFYSLKNPNGSACAGDNKIYYKTVGLDDGFPQTFYSQYSSDATSKPNFIKNISVDLTDSNSTSDSNQAFGCSYGATQNAPPLSACSTFDFGVMGGVPTSLGGSVLVLGGVKGFNYGMTYSYHGPTVSCGPLTADASIATTCPGEMYALGIETLSSNMATDPPSELAPGITTASEPISSWSRLSSKSDYAGPEGVAGGSLSYLGEIQKILLLGGSAPFEGFGSTGDSSDTNDTWVFNIRTLSWEKYPTTVAISNQIKTRADNTADADSTDCSLSGETCIMQHPAQAAGGRAGHGYVAAAGFALGAMSTDPATATTNINPSMGSKGSYIDLTDRIISVGGLTAVINSTTSAYALNTTKFNPTFGPELVEADITGGVSQYIESYHSQIINVMGEDGNTTSPFRRYQRQLSGTGNLNGFGSIAAVSMFNGLAGTAGYVATAGGFSASQDYTDGADTGGTFLITTREGSENIPQNLIAVPTFNYIDPFAIKAEGDYLAPSQWMSVNEGAAIQTDQVPNFGGMTMVQGINAAENDVVIFGGVNCRSYLVKTGTNCAGGTQTIEYVDKVNTKYWKFSNNPSTYASGATSLTDAASNASGIWTAGGAGGSSTEFAPHNRAGMAAARGFDGDGNAIVVAIGGVVSKTGVGDKTGTVDAETNQFDAIFYLAGTGQYTWRIKDDTQVSSPKPPRMANSAMVYSHVTRKFYLFGGAELDPILKNNGDTWELSVSGDCTTGACSFTWKQLNTSDGMTCYPDCDGGPTARRSHKMVEVNYNNIDPLDDDPTCDESTPCSYGIFMEGGTTDGIAILSDRWFFDPTANGGKGHWSKVNDFPARKLASSAAITYYVPSQDKKIHRAVLFGGEMGNHSPNQRGDTDRYFVPATLGDTHVYDFDENKWHRVRLLGRGIQGYAPSTLTNDEEDEVGRRESYAVGTSEAGVTYIHDNLRVMTPPAIAGASMIVRLYPTKTLGSTTAVEPLKIPEIYMIGGRLKDGTYNTIDNLYKFCMGSASEYENPDDAADTGNGICDAYDDTDNDSSPFPTSDYVGRWFYRTPEVYDTTGTLVGAVTQASYMGSATYDPVHDKILLFGGLKPAAVGDKVTQSTRTADSYIYEYTFPTASLNTYVDSATSDLELQGRWDQVDACSGSDIPTARYGHSLTYDRLNHQIIVVGGYNAAGTALTQSYVIDGSTTSTSIPEVWKAKRDDGSNCYTWTQLTTFGNEIKTESESDMPLDGLGHFAAFQIPASGYNTGYYSTFDNSCVGAGVLTNDDSDLSKLLAGGAYIDIDRSQLDENENLLLSLTFFPLGQTNQGPLGEQLAKGDEAVFKIHLMTTNENEFNLQSTLQPRYLTYSDEQTYPKVVSTLSVMGAPSGQVQQEQLLLPISADPAIDRIRIERYSGSAILIDATIHRMRDSK